MCYLITSLLRAEKFAKTPNFILYALAILSGVQIGLKTPYLAYWRQKGHDMAPGNASINKKIGHVIGEVKMQQKTPDLEYVNQKQKDYQFHRPLSFDRAKNTICRPAIGDPNEAEVYKSSFRHDLNSITTKSAELLKENGALPRQNVKKITYTKYITRANATSVTIWIHIKNCFPQKGLLT